MKFEALMTALPDATVWAAPLAGAAPLVGGTRDLDILRIVSDSRNVAPGDLFVALPGSLQEGRQFVPQAIRNGAVAVLTEHAETTCRNTDVAWIEVPDARAALSALAAHFFGHPSAKMTLIGVTGTNGKTTTTFLIRAMLNAAGFKTGMMGTIGHDLAGETRPATHTTPDALSLQSLFSDMRDRGVTHVAMEVSSHALDQRRTEGCQFQAAVFTNLTQDHLDYHGNMDAYFSAKRKLFDQMDRQKGRAVINLDDPYGGQLKQALPGRNLGFGMTPPADIYPTSLVLDQGGIRMHVVTPMGALDVASPLMGRHNAYNLLAAIGVGVVLSLSKEQIVDGISALSAVPGRFEKIDAGQDFLVIVDYAHTEDALCRLLATAAALSPRRIVTVFGCGGDRDRGKRPKMGSIAGQMSDAVILTSDNPRSEPPLSIIEEIEAGVKTTGTPYQIVPDRRAAIVAAISTARTGEIVIIAGKGHETIQIIGNQTLPFDDREVARNAVMDRSCGRQSYRRQYASHTWPMSSPISIDSRTIREGDLFVALCGPRFDGHDYVESALQKGAAAAIVSNAAYHLRRDLWAPFLAALICVEDPLTALQEMARTRRAHFDGPVVGITGSNGKTTTKEMTAAILSCGGPVLSTAGNFNNQIGLSLSISRLSVEHRAAVLEMGISRKGEMRLLCQIATPTVGLITNIGPAHLEFLENVEGVAAEKGVLFESVQTAIVNMDDPKLAPWAAPPAAGAGSLRECWTYGLERAADVMASAVVFRTDGMTFDLHRHGIREGNIFLPTYGRHQVYNALAAATVAYALSRTFEEIRVGLAGFRPPDMRMQVQKIGDVCILLDAYNANPASMRAALSALAALPNLSGRRIALLGDMLELGAVSESAHREVGEAAARSGVDALVAVGQWAEQMARGARQAGLTDVSTYPDAESVVLKVVPGDCLLVKGSRGMKMERVLQTLQQQTSNVQKAS